jgi:hypothetical protein
LAFLFFISVFSVTSVLNLFGSSLDRRREKSVGSVHGWAGPEESVRVNETLNPDIFAQNPLQRASRSNDAKFALQAAKRFLYDELVFFGFERACRIDQSAERREVREPIAQEPHLTRMQVRKIFAA